MTTLGGEGVRCLNCGYGLAGLNMKGVCPACGTPVVASGGDGLLRYSAMSYLRSMRLWVGVIIWLIALEQVVDTAWGLVWHSIPLLQFTFQVYGLLELVIGVVAVVAVMVVTRHEPGRVWRDRALGPRQLFRWSFVVYVALWCLFNTQLFYAWTDIFGIRFDDFGMAYRFIGGVLLNVLGALVVWRLFLRTDAIGSRRGAALMVLAAVGITAIAWFRVPFAGELWSLFWIVTLAVLRHMLGRVIAQQRWERHMSPRSAAVAAVVPQGALA